MKGLSAIVKSKGARIAVAAAVAALCALFMANRLQLRHPVGFLALAALLAVGARLAMQNRQLFKNRRWMVLTLLFSAGFSLLTVLGQKIEYGGLGASYASTTMQPFHPLDILFFIVAAGCFFAGLMAAYLLLPRVPCAKQAQRQLMEKGRFAALRWTALFAGILAVCWLPVILTLYPGVLTSDSMHCIYQALGDIPLNNHHPVLVTLIFKALINGGALLGQNISRSVFLYVVLQTVVMAGVLGYSIYWLLKKGVHWLLCLFSLGYFAFSTAFAVYASNVQKDPLFGTVCFALVLFLADTVTREKPMNARRVVMLAALGLLVAFLRGNGIFIAIGVFVALLVWAKGARLRVGAACAAVLLLFGVVTGPVYGAFGITSSSIESYALPMQQLARTVVYQGSLSDADREFLYQIMPEEGYQAYTPGTVDSLKWRQDFSQAFLNNHQGEFLALWLRAFPRNMGLYAEAFLLNTMGFWKFGVKENYGFMDMGMSPNEYGIARRNLLELGLGINMEAELEQADFFGSGSLAWFMLACLYLVLARRKKGWGIPFVVGIILWLTVLVATPIAFSLRYVFLLALAVPVFGGLALLAAQRHEEGAQAAPVQ